MSIRTYFFSFLACFTVAASSTGCADTQCPSGTKRRGGACVGPDGVVVGDGGVGGEDGAVTTDCDAPVLFYEDGDGDGVGVEGVTRLACQVPAGYAASSGDCDDTCALCAPGGTETCDELDNDCDDRIDEGTLVAWYRDTDDDGFGDADDSVEACTAPAGFVIDGRDCDESERSIHPGADEVCDGADDDCDGRVDEAAIDAETYYRDGDGDGYGDPAERVTQCSPPANYVANAEDCDDANNAVNPDADFQTVPIPNHNPEDWDWNCDGAPEKEVTALGQGCIGDDFGDPCSGWQTGVPECGVEQFFNECSPVNLGGNLVCRDTAVSRQQRCR